MPDSYVTIQGEKGTVNISEEVIASIAGNALTEVEGISSFANTSGSELSELIGKKTFGKGVRVSFQEGNVKIDLTVLVRFGTNISRAAENAQHAVASAVESMTGLKSVVNVIVSGIAFDK